MPCPYPEWQITFPGSLDCETAAPGRLWPCHRRLGTAWGPAALGIAPSPARGALGGSGRLWAPGPASPPVPPRPALHTAECTLRSGQEGNEAALASPVPSPSPPGPRALGAPGTAECPGRRGNPGVALGGSQGVQGGHQPSALFNSSLFNSSQTHQTPLQVAPAGPPLLRSLAARLTAGSSRSPRPQESPRSDPGGAPRPATRSKTRGPGAPGSGSGRQEGHVPGHRLSAQATRRPLGRSMARGAAAGARCGAAGAASQSGSLLGAAPEPALRARRARRPDSRRVQRKWEGRGGGGEGRGPPLRSAGVQAGPLCHLGGRRAAASTPRAQTSAFGGNLGALLWEPPRQCSTFLTPPAVTQLRVCAGKMGSIFLSQREEPPKLRRAPKMTQERGRAATQVSLSQGEQMSLQSLF